jgi:glycerophosphoryl diester phosphodiesterase
MNFLQGRVRPVIIAHRGSSASAPENTMAAFRLAAEEGAEMIELDVRMSRDGHLVVHHDRRLGRTSLGRGRVPELSLEELRRVDAGSWFGRSFAGERIPLLAEVLAWLPVSMGLNIEVKTDGDRRGAASIAPVLQRVLRRSGALERVLLSSFDHTFLQMAHIGTPGLAIGALVNSLAVPGRAPAAIGRRTGASVIILHRRALRARDAVRVRAAGMALVCYGIETRAHLKGVRSRCLDGMMTNTPARLRRLLEESV